MGLSLHQPRVLLAQPEVQRLLTRVRRAARAGRKEEAVGAVKDELCLVNRSQNERS